MELLSKSDVFQPDPFERCTQHGGKWRLADEEGMTALDIAEFRPNHAELFNF